MFLAAVIFVQFAFLIIRFPYKFFSFFYIFLVVRKVVYMLPMLYKGSILNPSVPKLFDHLGKQAVNSAVQAGNFLDRIQNNFNNTVDTKSPIDPIGDFISSLRNGVQENLDSAKEAVKDMVDNNSDGDIQNPPSGIDQNSSKLSPSTIDYLNAELAQYYGMGRSTAYQEALSNTAYQRAVKDMQAAGLNPAAIFGSGKGYTAGGVSYVDDGTSNSGYGASGGNKKLFSEGLYYGISTAVGLATAVLTKNPANYWIGTYATQGALGAMDAMTKR